MASIWQVTYTWTGLVGMPGYTNFFFRATSETGTEALAAVTKSRLFFEGIKEGVPTPCVMAPITDVRLLDETDGTLLNIFTVTGVAASTASGLAPHSAPTGAVVDWLTTTVHGGRRMQGRTFIVPLSNGSFEDNGSLGTGTVATLAAAAEAMRTATGPAFGVWGRPKWVKPATDPPTLELAGLWGPAVSSRVPDKACVLRSRRD